MQTRKQSMIEVGADLAIGSVGSWMITWWLAAHAGFTPVNQATATVALCTVWSIVRRYTTRRYFNNLGAPSDRNANDRLTGTA